MLKQNVGCIDSFLRIFCGIWLTYAALHEYIGPIGYIGIVGILTGLSRVCPAYALVHADTGGCAKENHH